MKALKISTPKTPDLTRCDKTSFVAMDPSCRALVCQPYISYDNKYVFCYFAFMGGLDVPLTQIGLSFTKLLLYTEEQVIFYASANRIQKCSI
jgi:hypothetical protein